MDIVITDLSKSFGDRQVLTNFSAFFPEGKLSCIMGRSGCGKTTLLNILLGIIKADSGDISGMPERCSCVFQEDRLCEDFSAVSNVRIACAGRAGKDDIEAELRRVGLGESLRQPVKELSGGMKRRVAIVRALMAPYGLIIFDEPLKGLDSDTKALVAEYIKEKISGRTAIMVTHDEAEIALMGGRLIKMPELQEDNNEKIQ